MRTGQGEFCILESYGDFKRAVVFYKFKGGYRKEVNFPIPENQEQNWITVPITKEEYIKKLKYFTYLLTKEEE